MAVWSEIHSTDIIKASRIDGEYFKPEFLQLKEKLNCYDTLSKYLNEIIHPGEFKRKYSSCGVTVLRAQNVRPLKINMGREEIFIDKRIAATLPKNKIKFGDILITRTGANFGQTALYTQEKDEAVVTSHTFIVRTNDEINSAYLALFLNTKYGRKLIDQGMYGSSQPEIAPKFLKDIPIPRFSDKEEEELAKKVLEFYALRKESQMLENEAKQILKKELNLEIIEKDFSNNYEVDISSITLNRRVDSEYFNPRVITLINQLKRINHSKLRQYVDDKNGFPWESKYFQNDNSGEPVVRIRDIKPGFIDNKDLTSLDRDYVKKIGFTKANKNDIVVGMDGVKYFYSSLIMEPCYVNQRVCHLVMKEDSEVTPEYINFIINSEIGQLQLLREMTIASTVGHITNNNVTNIVIPLFNEEVRQKISKLIADSIEAEYLSKTLMFESIELLEKMIERVIK